LDINGFERPNNWIALSSKTYLKGKSGKIYKFLRSEGFEMDKHVFVGEIIKNDGFSFSRSFNGGLTL